MNWMLGGEKFVGPEFYKDNNDKTAHVHFYKHVQNYLVFDMEIFMLVLKKGILIKTNQNLQFTLERSQFEDFYVKWCNFNCLEVVCPYFLSPISLIFFFI